MPDEVPAVRASANQTLPLPSQTATIETVPPPSVPNATKYDPERTRENLRGIFASVLVGADVLATLGAGFAVIGGWISTTDLKDIGVVLLTPLYGLTSTALVFYFTSKK